MQGGVRVKLPQGVTWDDLAAMTPDQIRERGLFPSGFLPLPHVKQATGGQVFPEHIRSTRSATRKPATCGASMSISTFLTI